MTRTHEWLELLERLYARRNELAKRLGLAHRDKGQTAAQDATPHFELGQLDRLLTNFEIGLHPRCDHCGERIEMDRLQKDPLVTSCWRCAGRRAKTSAAKPAAVAP